MLPGKMKLIVGTGILAHWLNGEAQNVSGGRSARADVPPSPKLNSMVQCTIFARNFEIRIR
jgi:hypothetical protein